MFLVQETFAWLVSFALFKQRQQKSPSSPSLQRVQQDLLQLFRTGRQGSACFWDQTSPGFSSLAVPVTNCPSECNFDADWPPAAQGGTPRSASIEIYWGKTVGSVLGPKESSVRQSQEGHIPGQGSLSLPHCSWGSQRRRVYTMALLCVW